MVIHKMEVPKSFYVFSKIPEKDRFHFYILETRFLHFHKNENSLFYEVIESLISYFVLFMKSKCPYIYYSLSILAKVAFAKLIDGFMKTSFVTDLGILYPRLIFTFQVCKRDFFTFIKMKIDYILCLWSQSILTFIIPCLF